MCNPISWWYVRANGVGRLLISDKTDSHSEAAAEFGVKDAGLGQICAGEFSPNDEKPSPDLGTWNLVWDYLGRTRRPEWMDDEAEASLRAALERACAKYVYATGRHEVTSCRAFAFGDANLVVRGACHVEAHGSSSVVAWDSSRVEAHGSSRVVARDSSHVEAHGSSRVEAYGSSRVEAHGSSRVEAYGSSRVEAHGSSRVEARDSSRVEAWESSSVEAWESSSVVAYGSSRVEAYGSSRVEAHGSSRVEARESSSVVAYGSSRVEVKSEYADVVGRGEYDGNGYPILRTPIEIGCTYTIKDGMLVAVTSGATP